jgi:hypothetical protein
VRGTLDPPGDESPGYLRSKPDESGYEPSGARYFAVASTGFNRFRPEIAGGFNHRRPLDAGWRRHD